MLQLDTEVNRMKLLDTTTNIFVDHVSGTVDWYRPTVEEAVFIS